MLNVIMLSVVMLNGVAQVIKKSRRVQDIHHNSQCSYAGYRILFIVRLNGIMLSVIMLNVIMLSVVMLNNIMLSVVMLNVIMLSTVISSVVMLNAMALVSYAECHIFILSC